MALIFSDEFEGTLGSDPPAGWTKQNLSANATVSTGGYHNQCVVFGNGGSIYQTMGSTSTAMSVFVVAYANQGIYDPLNVAQKVVVGTVTSYSNFATVSFSNDLEIRVKDGAGVNICFGEAGHHYRGRETEWTFMQADFTATATTIGTASALKIDTTLRLNGEVICSGNSTFLSSLGNFMDTIFLNGASNVNAKVDSLYVYSPPLAPTIVTPNEAAGRKARVSQAVVEHPDLPSASKARVSQALVEYPKLPSASNARVSQAVIELILTNAGGWQVYES